MTRFEVADDLLTQLSAADEKFHRPAAPAVYAAYEDFIATGAYPYIDDVVAFIAARHDIPVQADPSPGPRYPSGLGKVLSHEVYLASGQHHLAKMIALEAELTTQGYRPITELDPLTVSKIQLADGTTYRLASGFGYAKNEWALLAPRQRTNGRSLSALVQAHRNYERAKAEGQTRHNGPAVVMYKDAS